MTESKKPTEKTEYHFWRMDVKTNARELPFKLYVSAQNAVHARKRLLNSFKPGDPRYLSGDGKEFLESTKFSVLVKEDSQDQGKEEDYNTVEEALTNGWLFFEKGSTLVL